MKKKILFILMPENFQEAEFQTPYLALTAKHHVDVAGLQPGEAKGAQGFRHTPNLQLDELTSKDFENYDAVVIPGGPGSKTYLWGNKKVQQAVSDFHFFKKLVAVICHACVVPAQAGILKGLKATVYPTDDAKAIFQQEGVHFVDQGCFVDAENNIITAQSPKFAKDFADAILDQLEK